MWQASFSDGTSAQAQAAQVRLGPEGLEITLAAGGREIWPYGELVSSGPLLPGHDVQVGLKSRPGARLHVAEAGFAEALAHRAPQLAPRAHRRRVLVPMFAAVGVILAIGAWLAFSSFSPARIIAGMIPQQARQAMGEQLARSMAEKGFCTRPAGAAALRRMVARLAPRGDASSWSVRVARLGMINAFTLPGGHIVISEGLISLADNPEEVAGVLAHEMGHALELHPETSLVRSIGISAAAVMLTGNSSNLGEFAALLLQMRYSRQAEREADDWALKLLRRAQVPAGPLAHFFEKMMLMSGEGGALMEALSTHPATKERIAHVRKAGSWPSRKLLSKAQWRALREICEGERK